MIRKRWAERMGSMVTYLRGHGFVAIARLGPHQARRGQRAQGQTGEQAAHGTRHRRPHEAGFKGVPGHKGRDRRCGAAVQGVGLRE